LALDSGHEHQARALLLHLRRDSLHDCIQVASLSFLAQIDEAHRPVDFVALEKAILLLVAQHLQGRFAQHREVKRWTFGGCEGEHHLVGQRGLAASGRAGDQIEGELRQAAAEHFVKPWNSRRKHLYVYFVGHLDPSLSVEPGKEPDQMELSIRWVKAGPIRVPSSS